MQRVNETVHNTDMQTGEQMREKKNFRGKTAWQVINEELIFLGLTYDERDPGANMIAAELRGKINIAAEYGLINIEEWGNFLNGIFIITEGTQ